MEITSRGELATGQTPPAAHAAKHPDRLDASPVPLVASASASGGVTHCGSVRRASAG
jgi:hypothetical protein